MKSFNFTIPARLNLAFGLVFIFMLILGAVFILQSSKIWNLTKDLYDHPYTVSQSLLRLKSDFQVLDREMKIGLETRLKEDFFDHFNAMQKSNRLIDDEFEVIKENYLGPREDIHLVISAFVEYEDIQEQIHFLVQEGRFDEARSMYDEAGQNTYMSLLNALTTLQEFADQKGIIFYDSAQQTFRNTQKLFLFFVLAILILVFILIYLLTRSINQPLSRLNRLADNVQNGKFETIPLNGNRDELNNLGVALNGMIKNLNKRIELDRFQQQVSHMIIEYSGQSDLLVDIIPMLTSQMKAGVSALYVFNEPAQTYQCTYSIGFDEEKLPQFKKQSFEGDFATTLRTGQIDFISVQHDHEQYVYKSILGRIKIVELVTIPVLHNDDIEAIIVLGRGKEFSQSEKEYLLRIWPIINTAYNNVLRELALDQANQELNALNEELQGQSEELITQSEELSVQSEELATQNKELDQVYKQLKKEKDTLDQKIGERTKELQEEKLKAEESDKLKTAFLANMSHEIRTPMNSILGFTELIMEEELTDIERNRYLEIINLRGEHLLKLINDLIEISKIEAGIVTISNSQFIPSQLIDEIFEVASNDYKDFESIRLVISVPEPHRSKVIESDAMRIKQVLENLISNAFKYTQKGSIEFGYDYMPEKKVFEFFVKDTGEGISVDEQKAVFERFVQVGNSVQRLNKGTGLGLPISKAIIEALNGRIWLKSEIGKGSTFIFELPEKIEN